MRKQLFILIISVLSIITVAQQPNKYYLTDQAGQPWGSNTNINAMNMAFGPGNWIQGYFQTINVNALLQPTVCFIYCDGSSTAATSFNTFLSANLPAIQNWVFNGGKLFLNAGPTAGGNISYGFGGVVLNYPIFNTAGTASPGMSNHPIFLGPMGIATLTHTGNYYAHGAISGGTTVPVQSGTLLPILTERFWGLGRVMFGGKVTTNWQSPQPSAANLRSNILSLLGGCCGSTSSITAVANPTSLICGGQSVTITTSGAPGGTYQLFPGGATGQSFVITPSVSANYNIVGTPSAGCGGGATIRIPVGPGAPTLAVTGNTSICPGGTINLTASGANSYSWSTGAITNTITQTPTQNTFYTVVGTGTNGCSATFTRSIIVNPTPTITFGGTVAVCNGNPAYIIALGANSYSWSNGALTYSLSVSPTVATNYSVIGTSLAGCTGTGNVTVNLGITPTVAVSGNTALCNGQTSTLSATGAVAYFWMNGPLTASYVVTPTINTTYTVVGYNVGGCYSALSVPVVVGNTPTVTIIGTNTLCAGQTTTLSAGGANTYLWNNGFFGQNLVITPSANISYTALGTSSVGCTGSSSISISVTPLPTITVIGANTICVGETTTLTASGANTYTWNIGGSTNTFIIVSPTVSTTYTIGGSTNGCSATNSLIPVTVLLCTGIDSQINTDINIKIYPNPNKGEFLIESPDKFYILELLDVSGRIVLKTKSTENKSIIQMQNLENGIYFARLKGEKYSQSFKIIKE